jgi:electron transfer flavoprotein alpha subunit
LKTKCILNGGMAAFQAQAEELNGFLDDFLSEGNHPGSTILFHTGKEDRDALLAYAPTDCVELVRVDCCQPETILAALQHIEDKADTVLYLFPPGFSGADLAVRWAFRRQGSSLVQVEQVAVEAHWLIAKKKAYADHVLASFRLERQPFCIAPARGCEDRLPIKERHNRQIIQYDLTGLKKEGVVRDDQWIPAEQAGDLAAEKLLIVGGRGLGTRENVNQLKDMAHAMGAAFGISRPVALNAWAGMHRLIGVSGTLARPEVCIAAGVSGAAAFYAGIEKSKIIIGINIDPQARILKAADVAVIDDYKAVMEALLKIFELDCKSEA